MTSDSGLSGFQDFTIGPPILSSSRLLDLVTGEDSEDQGEETAPSQLLMTPDNVITKSVSLYLPELNSGGDRDSGDTA